MKIELKKRKKNSYEYNSKLLKIDYMIRIILVS